MAWCFADRVEAGRALGERLAQGPHAAAVVLALPRGGVPVAAEVAHRLGAPLDLLLVRKIGARDQPELAVAAVVDGEPPDIIVDDELLRVTRTSRAYVDSCARHELQEIDRQRRLYLAAREPLALAGRTAIVVDDGIATGTSVRAALRALRRRGATRVVLAVPVAPVESLELLRPEVDEIVCLLTPRPFIAVGAHYADFEQVDDAAVIAALQAAFDRGG